MSKHIELVKKWLADPDSVTQRELESNAAAADATAAAAYAADAAWDAADTARAAARAATRYAAAADYDTAAYWVKEYAELADE